MQRFFAALKQGDTEPLVELLAEDATFYGDGGGKAPQIWAPVAAGRRSPHARGLPAVAVRRGYSLRLAEVNGDPGLLGFDADGTLIAAQAFEISGGRIQAIRSIVNPDKLPTSRERSCRACRRPEALVGGRASSSG